MKKIIYSILGISLMASTGCLKDDPPVDFGTVGTIIEIPYSGLQFFTDAALNFTADTISYDFNVNIASPYPLEEDLTVEVGVDEAAIAEYNASGGVQYVVMPSDAYIFTGGSATIPAGSRLADFSIKFVNSASIDPSVNYMLPISILNAEGEEISGNFGTIYYHIIGQCIAGSYSASGTRTNYSGQASGGIVSSVVGIENFDPDKTLAPLDPETVTMNYADLGVLGWKYEVVFDCDADEIVSVSPNSAMSLSIFANSFKVFDKTYDPATRTMYLKTGYTNSSGNERIIEETFVKK
jgi:hypothetical protein